MRVINTYKLSLDRHKRFKKVQVNRVDIGEQAIRAALEAVGSLAAPQFVAKPKFQVKDQINPDRSFNTKYGTEVSNGHMIWRPLWWILLRSRIYHFSCCKTTTFTNLITLIIAA